MTIQSEYAIRIFIYQLICDQCDPGGFAFMMFVVTADWCCPHQHEIEYEALRMYAHAMKSRA